MEKKSPYQGLPPRAFWRIGLAETDYPPADIYRPRWSLLKSDRIVTAGSCFAQHVGRALRRSGFNVLDTEPAPDEIAPDRAAQHGYGLYSARYGNIYTTRQLRQLIEEAWDGSPWFDDVWELEGRFYDAMRPNIKPNGFADPAAVRAARAEHLVRVREAFSSADVFVFTLGLTEAWFHKPTGQVYASAPGTIAGRFDPAIHGFANFRLAEIRADLETSIARLKRLNPDLRVLLTVSPVPLTATASENHVLSATIQSKSILRAVAGEMTEDFPEIDYFPSYEIVTSSKAGGSFFEQNLRTVRDSGVATVMNVFIGAHTGRPATPTEANDAEQERNARRSQKKPRSPEGRTATLPEGRAKARAERRAARQKPL